MQTQNLVLVSNSTSGRWIEPALKQGWHVLAIEYGQGDGVWLLGLGHKRYCYFCLCRVDCYLWGKPAVTSCGHSSSPVERPMWRGTNFLARSELSSKWVLQPQQPFIDCNSWRSLSLNYPAKELKGTWQKILPKGISDYSYFESLSCRVICNNNK